VLEELSVVKEERVLVLERGARFGVLMNAPGSRFRSSLCASNLSDDSPFEESLGEGVTGDTGVRGFGAKRDGSGRGRVLKRIAHGAFALRGLGVLLRMRLAIQKSLFQILQWLLLLLCAPL
jgi:hypothetical protein